MIFSFGTQYVTRSGLNVLAIDTNMHEGRFRAQIAFPACNEWREYKESGAHYNDANLDILTVDQHAQIEATSHLDKLTDFQKEVCATLYRHKSRIAAVRYVREAIGVGLRMGTVIADRIGGHK